MSTSTPTALVAAAPTLFRQGLLALLREQCTDIRLTLTADVTEIAELLMSELFGLAIIDGTLPGLELDILLKRLRSIRPSQRLLVLADPRTPAARSCASTWPGDGVLLPTHVPPHTLASVLAPWLNAQQDGTVPRRKGVTHTVSGNFSRRELEVLRLVVADYCNEEIADRLFINVRTVETHRRNLLQKAGTRTLVGLAARAVREGWVA